MIIYQLYKQVYVSVAIDFQQQTIVDDLFSTMLAHSQ